MELVDRRKTVLGGFSKLEEELELLVADGRRRGRREVAQENEIGVALLRSGVVAGVDDMTVAVVQGSKVQGLMVRFLFLV